MDNPASSSAQPSLSGLSSRGVHAGTEGSATLHDDSYVYHPLPTKTSVRLLRRDGRGSDGVLNLTFRTVDLNDYPIYHCLSYTWGNPHASGTVFQSYYDSVAAEYAVDQKHPVRCDGKILRIQTNLLHALEQLPTNAWARRVQHRYEHMNGQYVLHMVSKMGDRGLMQSYLYHGAEVNCRDYSGKTPLHYAVHSNQAGALQMLVDAGADVNATDNDGKTPLDYAKEMEDPLFFEYLERVRKGGQPHDGRLYRDAFESKYDDWIWIDSLCINQADLNEREAQVAMMGRVYSQAGYVLGWLGKEDNRIMAGIGTISKITLNAAEFETSDIVPFQTTEESEYARHGLPTISKEEWDGFAALLSRQWFRRVWVIQEVVFAADIVVFCGHQEVAFTELTRACRAVQGRYDRMGYISSRHYIPLDAVASSVEYFFQQLADIRSERVLAIRHQHPAEDAVDNLLTFGSMIITTLPFAATDPRDKIFALIPLSAQGGAAHIHIRPDYSKPVEHCYADFTKKLMKSYKNLTALSWVQDRSARRIQTLPSWVPDYSLQGSNPMLSRGFSAVPRALDGPAEVLNTGEAADTCVLWISGFPFDTITSTTASRPFGSSSLRKYALEPTWFEVLSSLEPQYHTGEDRAEAFWRTLCADTDAHDEHPAPAGLGRAFKKLVCAQVCECVERRLASSVSLIRGLAHVAAAQGGSEVDMDAAWFSRHRAELIAKTSIEGDDFDEARPTLRILELLSRTRDGTETDGSIPTLADVEAYMHSIPPEHLQTFEFSVGVGIGEDGSTNLYMPSQDFLETRISDTLASEAGNPFGIAMYRTYSARRVFVTRGGYLGLGPMSMEEGDVVYLVPGSKVPLILRPLGGEEGEAGRERCALVGGAYVHGIMHGEAFERDPGLRDRLERLELH